MTPGSDCHQRHSLLRNSKGQLTIFFAVTLLVVITVLAFIINIGLFVKAKINLQNAVDAAAYSGASVQARQLSRISYLNWEMRNVYKEWMFKYYVLGNLNVVHRDDSGISNFRAEDQVVLNQTQSDNFNFPSICIHYGGGGNDIPNLCQRASVPGVPVFSGDVATGIGESFQELINVITSEKNLDCANRSELNFLAANLWAYGLPDSSDVSSILSDSPHLAPNRKGAFPSAIELAIRIRNLEHQMNLPPASSGVCAFPGRAAGNCNEDIRSNNIGASNAKERTTKAFYSAYRNLGNGFDREMKDSFTLTELAPTVVIDPTTNSLSNHLIPEGSREKYYLDLKLMSVNLVTFYTAFVSSTEDNVTAGGENVQIAAQCSGSKIALPVPGYPLGFYKNQDVMTYYSVKGEAFFQGLFNPFNDRLKLTAFATAKPFGGRIGPHLFREDPRGSSLIPRQDNSKSNPYVMGINMQNLGSAFQVGYPIPLDGANRFWVQTENDFVGGEPVSANQITFSIPNLPYDYGNGFSSAQYNSGENLPVISPPAAAPRTGLYSYEQLTRFRANMPEIGTFVTPTEVDDGINRVRRPTRYEMANYLIPTAGEFPTDSFPIIPNDGGKNFSFYLYAPLFSNNQQDTLYSDVNNIIEVLETFLVNQGSSIQKYKQSMNDVAISIAAQDNALDAARAVSDIDDYDGANTQNPSCLSINGKFIYFYIGETSVLKNSTDPNCPTPFKELARNYWSQQSSGSNNDFHLIEFSKEGYDRNLEETMYTAYRPGIMQGATNGNLSNPLSSSGSTVTMKRNFYSTKFIPTKAVLGSGNNWFSTQFTMVSEGNKVREGLTDLVHDPSHKNRLDSALINVDLGKLETVEW